MELIRSYINKNGLYGSSRKRKYVYERIYLFAYLRYTYKMSLQKIGAEFNRDHATVIHGLKTYDFFKDDKVFQEYTEDVQIAFPMGILVKDNQSQCLMYEILGTLNDVAFAKNF
ncbi:MAG: hypothetical protein Unbinned3907contig1000_23 [Prokaryotic dsDNA virus sp.]|nr:MAG: hypothetical protein Unbinned3907contig1000_23 [Prokaryotic dsDNA virus sp.]|tara:strand:+ start:1917 stop:2258 length:342 start_codon:yes stop_codon:yes gene_type:complete